MVSACSRLVPDEIALEFSSRQQNKGIKIYVKFRV